MHFESKVKRTVWLNIVVSTIPDITIAIILAVVFAAGFLGFLAIFFGLQILYLLIWMKNSIFGWALFLLIGRRQMSKYLYDFLIENKFPDPGDYQESVDSYFYNILNDEELPIEIRFRAAYEIASLETCSLLKQTQQLMRINIAYEDAIEKYKSSFAPSHH